MKQYVTDLALALLKSTPSNVVLDIPIDEQININSARRVDTETNSAIVNIYKMDDVRKRFPVDQYKRVLADQVQSVPGEIYSKTIYFGVAFLSKWPDEYDLNRQKLHSLPIDIEEDKQFYAKHGITTDDNNFATMVATCRALYSWLSIDQLNSPDPIIIQRDTGTSLPPGDYVFKVYRSTRYGYSESIPKVPSPEGEGFFPIDPYPDWYTRTHLLTRKGLCWDPCLYEDRFSDLCLDVTVRISKSDWHSNSKSVDNGGGKGRKVKNSKGQTTPSPAKG